MSTKYRQLSICPKCVCVCVSFIFSRYIDVTYHRLCTTTYISVLLSLLQKVDICVNFSLSQTYIAALHFAKC